MVEGHRGARGLRVAADCERLELRRLARDQERDGFARMPRHAARERIRNERRAAGQDDQLAPVTGLTRGQPVRAGQASGEDRREVAIDLGMRDRDPLELSLADRVHHDIVDGSNRRRRGLVGEKRHFGDRRAGLHAPDRLPVDQHLGGSGFHEIHLPRVVALRDDDRPGREGARLQLPRGSAPRRQPRGLRRMTGSRLWVPPTLTRAQTSSESMARSGETIDPGCVAQA